VRDVTERKIHEQALKRSESQLRLLSQRVLQVQEDERARIARDLHDQLGQELVYLRMKAQSLAEQIGESSDAHESVAELVNLIDQTRSTSHRIAVSVSPPILDDMGLVRAVRQCAGDFSRRSSIACFVDAPIGNIGVPKDVATAAYRILQEALTNVWKHA
jgi:signal transduction histidine kinase